ncbi:phosphoribosylformylglycinamidine cyclo-ligase [Alkalihalobacillus sp. AL-G]|uniref:phosphoribosylformylglycinamidine cyclo-ligase n=1 Tax=Alkalihalobacillus sp. AL-G TaxID=2926399 RepID=UPI0027295FBE|nr:phosphoribosylformylglycinamidine cyclo-ligase [Alkalihalobacillus sp. AL-G]WLD93736.1 phosphoribosylformylglycinamidine cyclo-ligase [Alkalihalobacillus sp. AL-G]
MAQAYKSAGVDVEAGYEAVNRMKKHVKETMRPEVLGGIGAFGGMFDLSKINVKEPVLVSGTDGVGTKLMLAIQMDKHDTIGIDAVAMCVNDIVAQGAEPLYFLDYIACGKLEPEKVEQIVKGIADGCKQAGAALIGGETAEMPGMYDAKDYDLAGFTVGIAEKSKLINPENVQEGDALIGIASSGIHSNGYSLVRKVLFEQADYAFGQTFEQLDKPLGEEVLTPTKIYVKPVLNVLKSYEVSGIAHITGGGFNENIPRMLPEGLSADIDFGSWPIPAIFSIIQTAGDLSMKDMLGTFNMGIGMVLAVKNELVVDVIRSLEDSGEKAYTIGRVKEGEGITFGGGTVE